MSWLPQLFCGIKKFLTRTRLLKIFSQHEYFLNLANDVCIQIILRFAFTLSCKWGEMHLWLFQFKYIVKIKLMSTMHCFSGSSRSRGWRLHSELTHPWLSPFLEHPSLGLASLWILQNELKQAPYLLFLKIFL